MYSYIKKEYGIYVIVFKNKGDKKETWIASTDTAEKADFLVKAANKFRLDGSNY